MYVGGGGNNTEESRTPWNFPKLRRFWYFFLLARRVLTYIISEYLILFVNFMLGQTPKKIFFIYLAVKRYHKFRKMARNFADFGVFLRLTIYVYTYIILECLILDGYFMLYQTIKKKFACRPIQRNPAFGENLRNFRIFWAFFPTTFRRIGRFVSKLVFSYEKSAM